MTSPDSEQGITRRGLIIGGAAAGLGAAAVFGAGTLVGGAIAGSNAGGPGTQQANGSSTVDFFGPNQAGVETSPQAHASFIALDLVPGVDRAGLQRWMRILTDDAARMTQGTAALADMEPELAIYPANLTVTFGFGPKFMNIATGSTPDWVQPLPAFSIDQLSADWSDGDFIMQICSDDPVTVSHTARMLLKDSRAFATVRWVQDGYRRAAGTAAAGTHTMRNLFGQVDEMVNPTSGSPVFSKLVYRTEGPMKNGTSMVVRRIQMHLDAWDRLDRPDREEVIGRKLASGALLTSPEGSESAPLDTTNAAGMPIIPDYAHVRRARGDANGPQFLRRGYSFGSASAGDSVTEAGLIFASFQADPLTQFVPVQSRLAELDILNQWTTPIGSAVFAIPPGCAEGGYIGETILG